MDARRDKSFFKNIAKKDGWLDIDVSMLKLYTVCSIF